MSQRDVERTLGRLPTDQSFRDIEEILETPKRPARRELTAEQIAEIMFWCTDWMNGRSVQ